MIPIFSQPFCVATSVCRGKMPAGRPERECKAAEGVSKGINPTSSSRAGLRAGMGGKDFRQYEALSREISCPNAS